MLKATHVIIVGVLAIIFAYIQTASAQDGSVTPEILEQCRELGIEPEDCSEQAILEKRGGHIPATPEAESLGMNWFAVAAIVASLGGAALFFIVRSTRKKVSQT